MFFFTNLTTPQSLWLVLFLTIAFLIGIFTGRLVTMGRIRQQKAAADALNAQLSNTQTDLKDAQEKLTVKEADSKRMGLEIERNLRLIRESEAKRQQLEEDLAQAKNHFEQLSSKMNDFHQNSLLLKQDLAEQVNQKTVLMAKIEDLAANEAILKEQLEKVDAKKMEDLQQEVTSLRYVKTLLEQERDDLTRSLNETATSLETVLQKKENEAPEKVYVINQPNTKGGETKELSTKEALAMLKEMIGEVIPMATAIEKDDLKCINGIGPFIEEKLNEVGIYTYEQISLFDDEFIEILTMAIGFFPDRIKRGRWVEQAKEQWEEKEISKLMLPPRESEAEK
jgi:predicted flap endonuclease-1-like 5' DNA nuclease